MFRVATRFPARTSFVGRRAAVRVSAPAVAARAMAAPTRVNVARAFSQAAESPYENIKVSVTRFPPTPREGESMAPDPREVQKDPRSPGVGIIELDRPRALNALSPQLIKEINEQVKIFDDDDTVAAIIITGSMKAFCAGADIVNLNKTDSMASAQKSDPLAGWNGIDNARKPIIAAVAGHALGGGAELAMMCDIIIAADNARFAQPEIILGTIPGLGGTQRLVRAVGKSRAMELCLTGDRLNADEAKQLGLVSKVVPLEDLLHEALKVGEKIARQSKPVVAMCKAAVNASYEMTLAEGLKYERTLFHATYATDDRREGMKAFIEKRKPQFTHT